MRRMMGCAVAVFALGACASNHVEETRGWVGGRFADVHDVGFPHGPEGWGEHGVVGLPASVGRSDANPGGQDGGALLVSAGTESPLADAGLAPGDLVLAVGDRTVTSAEELREAAEALVPGERASVRFWRAGEVHTAEAVVGRERYDHMGMLALGIGIGLSVDLWPFDDGIDVLHLVQFRTRSDTPDLAGPEAAYLRAALPGEQVSQPDGRGWYVHLLVLGFGRHERILGQEKASD